MKTDLHDITFLMLIRLDSIDRLENFLVVTDQLCRYFHTNILVFEVDKCYNRVLKKVLNKSVDYCFIEDKDPVLYRTRYLNKMVATVNTPYLAVWDADIAIDKYAIMDSVESLRKGGDVAYPYDGYLYEVSPVIRSLYLRHKDIRILHRHKDKMILLHDNKLVGGAFFIRTDKYILSGMENEKHYGWGNEDFDRYYRFINQGLKIYRSNTSMFHLFHPRIKNSSYRSVLHTRVTKGELKKTMNSLREELL